VTTYDGMMDVFQFIHERLDEIVNLFSGEYL
jgi:hypothetical protein